MAQKSASWRDTANFLSFSRDMTEQSKGLKQLELTMLREECAELALEGYYSAYIKRLYTSQIGSFVFILATNVCLHVILMMGTLTSAERSAVLNDAVIYLVICSAVICIVSINFVSSLQKRFPSLPYVTTVTAVILLVAMATDTSKIISETVFLLCLNLVGILVRFSREVVTRMIFLDKRQCIEEKLLFYAAKDQERNLLLSMIPQQIAKQMEVDVRMRIGVMKNSRNSRKPKPHTFDDVRKLFIEPHEDVTILYADIVNFTYLTTTLDVRTLVGTLHDLYVRFDDAADEFSVLRIQFLGDCYYCVANVSIPNEEHAKACVKLGLRMISEIRAVSEIRELDIDMRIGVHSGSVLSGVIGANKWQFDIYSRDVDIANRLESTGVPGRVHISAATLEQLDGKFRVDYGTERARNDPLLRKYQITTFLIKDSDRKSVFRMQSRDSFDTLSKASSQSRIKHLVAMELGEESLKMPTNSVVARYRHIFFGQSRRVSPIQQEVRNFYSNISWLFMWYKNWRWELGYMQQMDIMQKYSLFVSYIIILSTILMQVINLQQSLSFWCLVVIGNIFLLLTLFLLDCDRFSIENEVIEKQAHEDDIAETFCFYPWALTEGIVLNLAIIFLFSHISYTLKWIIGSAVLIGYSLILFVMFTFIFEIGISSNQYFYPEYAHIIFVVIAVLAFHLVTREIEFISRMDYNWKHELKKKKEHAKFTNETISILISNILPSHIVDIYMKDQLTDLYHEEYENVAVMFATIQNFDTEMVGMRILNEIICDFDEVLGTYVGRSKVEKIKVAGWTYMAACGLNASEIPHQKNRVLQRGRTRSELRLTVLSGAEHISKRSPEQTEQDANSGNDFVFVMVCFALDLLRCMKLFNEQSIQGESRSSGALRIGISNGPIMAGVVGTHKPFYDIWGNAVNMASRMDSTGLPGLIQVTEQTALILKNYNVKSTFRGQTYVKGRGEIPTYFIDIDETLHFKI
ncbi:adenylyl cyclase X E-like [Eurosta solidaginis]|uniref:adenylyl cyclase X E-like n=1 Tax=Eurosta solidaginis TaxID=178769 RepID=UPI0035312ED3